MIPLPAVVKPASGARICLGHEPVKRSRIFTFAVGRRPHQEAKARHSCSSKRSITMPIAEPMALGDSRAVLSPDLAGPLERARRVGREQVGERFRLLVHGVARHRVDVQAAHGAAVVGEEPDGRGRGYPRE
jgi:hypothetical protein